MNFENITDSFAYASHIEIYNGSESVPYSNDIASAVAMTLSDAQQMPAFGVSLHNETVSAMNGQAWIQFCYEQEYECGDLPFDKLLIFVSPTHSGCNIVRHYAGGYNGRCFYLNLCGDMSVLYAAILRA